eukprot:1520744-Rhodomonas_salina.2
MIRNVEGCRGRWWWKCGVPRMPWCRERCDGLSCRCWKAKFRSQCGSCDGVIIVNDCTVKPAQKWIHAVCGREEKRGMATVISSMVETSDFEFVRTGDKRERETAQRQLEFGEPSDCGGGGAGRSGGSRCDEGVVAVKMRRSGDRKEPTEEQRRILEYVPKCGEVVRINSCAGSGKTTMAAMLCGEVTKRNSSSQIGYFVFGRGNMEDARASNKFGRNVSINTTHAFAKQQICPHMDAVGNLDCVTVVEFLDLEAVVRERLGSCEVTTITGMVGKIVIRTVLRFCQSSSMEMARDHIHPSAWPSPASAKDSWREELSKNGGELYLGLARELWAGLVGGAVAVSHDVYLKQFQVSKVHIGAVAGVEPSCSKCGVRMVEREGGGVLFHGCPNFPSCREKVPFLGFDVLIVDEAQDFTPCQWAAF